MRPGADRRRWSPAARVVAASLTLCALIALGVLLAAPKATPSATSAALRAACSAPDATWTVPKGRPPTFEAWSVYAGQSIEVVFPRAARGATIDETPSWPGVLRPVCTRTTREGARETTYQTLIPGNVVFAARLHPRHGAATTWTGQLVVNAAPPKTVWTKRLVARLVRSAGETELDSRGGHMPFGALVPASDAGTPTPDAGHRAVRFALGDVDGFQYPLRTVDAGKTWRVDGEWFAGPWADGAAFAGTMTTFTPNVAAAWGDGQVLYTTVDAGRRWYGEIFPGTVSSVAEAAPPASRAGVEFTVTQTSPYGPGLERGETYRSRDGGRVWVLAMPSR